jgi:hypothetical protein
MFGGLRYERENSARLVGVADSKKKAPAERRGQYDRTLEWIGVRTIGRIV